MADAMKKHPNAEVLVSFASLRSAYESTMETMEFPQVLDSIVVVMSVLGNAFPNQIMWANI